MKIAYFLTHPIQYQSPLIRALCDAGVDVEVVYGPMAADWAKQDSELGRDQPWDVSLMDGYPFQFLKSPFWFGLAGLFCLHSRIKNLLEQKRPGAVWVHGWGDVYSVAAWSAAWELGIPVLLRGETHLKCLKGGRIRRWLHRLILSHCFHTVSQFLAIGSANREFYLSYGVPAGKIVPVPYAVDNAHFVGGDVAMGLQVQAWRQDLGIANTDLVVGFFGKLKKAKRPDLALRAVAAYAAELPSNQKPWLLFVGDGPLRNKMEALAERIYPGRTRFLGFQNQSRLPGLYHLINLLLLPSEFEPWGLVVNEAMCAGRPAVVSERVGAAPDLVDGTGRVFRSGSLEDLVGALSLLSDPGALKGAGESAAQRMQTWSIREDVEGLKSALKGLPRVRGLSPERRPSGGVVAAYLGVHQVFQMGAAAAEVGRLEHFYCSLIRFPGRLGELLARWLFIPSALPLGAEVMLAERVSEIPVPLLVQRLADHVFSFGALDPLHTNRWFGTLVARHLPRHSEAGIMVAAETCALELFVVAKQMGMCCVMDCHGIPTWFLQDGVKRGAAELGLQAPHVLDSAAMAERKMLERGLADVLVVCSELQKELYLQAGIPEKKLKVVPLWVDAQFWHPPPVPREVPAHDRPLKVMYAGAGSLGKGLPYLLAVLDEVDGAGVELTLVGPMQPDMKPLLDAVRAPIRCLSYRPRTQLRELYWNHDLLVMPSLGDSFGFVAIEAMSCGLPVIVTDRCGVPVPAAEWRVPAFSGEAILSRLQYYRREPSRCRDEGLIAAAFAHQWTSQRYRDSIRAIYDELRPCGVVTA